MTGIQVDRAACSGHGVCEAIAPDIFHLTADESLEISVSQIQVSEAAALIQEAIEACPSSALRLVPEHAD